MEAYYNGKKISTSVVTAFNAAIPGHVSFILQKTELFPNLPTPSYMIKACTNTTADAVKDLTVCQADSCAVPVHR